MILIIATKATVKSKRYQIHLENLGFKNIIAIQTGLFVPLVEEGIFDGEILDATMRHYFRDIPTPRAIILGCTHFPLISSSISRYFNDRPLLIHSGDAIVEYLKDNYLLFNRGGGTDLKIFASENVSHLRDIAKYWYLYDTIMLNFVLGVEMSIFDWGLVLFITTVVIISGIGIYKVSRISIYIYLDRSLSIFCEPRNTDLVSIDNLLYGIGWALVIFSISPSLHLCLSPLWGYWTLYYLFGSSFFNFSGLQLWVLGLCG